MRYARVTDKLLDMQAELTRVSQENQTLFRMLRSDNDQRGVIPDRRPGYPAPIPLPPQPQPQPPYRPGSPGDAMGDSFGETFGDTE
jgi:hypothetical protein